ncbi:MAG: hypothetical protein WA584_23290 [Pyrinomonadaceae bacterium]
MTTITWKFSNKYNDKTWVAKTNGKSLQYGFDREFVNGEKEYSGKGRALSLTVEITEPGLYQIGGNSEDNGFRLVWEKDSELKWAHISEDRANKIAEMTDEFRYDLDFEDIRVATVEITEKTTQILRERNAAVLGRIAELRGETEEKPEAQEENTPLYAERGTEHLLESVGKRSIVTGQVIARASSVETHARMIAAWEKETGFSRKMSELGGALRGQQGAEMLGLITRVNIREKRASFGGNILLVTTEGKTFILGKDYAGWQREATSEEIASLGEIAGFDSFPATGAHWFAARRA